MKSHKYTIGERVVIDRAISFGSPMGDYEIIGLLPPRDDEFQYRVRRENFAPHRVIRESEISDRLS